MSFSTISRFATAVILSAMATSMVAAAEDSAFYIGPKGGDIRKGVPLDQQYHPPVSGFVVEGDVHPFATAKGNDGLGKGFQGSGYAHAVRSDRPPVAQDRRHQIGPKGGETRRGL